LTWLAVAIIAAAVTAFVSIMDSHLISKRLPSFQAFLAPIGLVHSVAGAVIFSINAVPPGTDATTVLIAFASGIVRVSGALIMLRTLRSEEVSRVMPVANTFPIFVAILAVPFLGETLGWLQWLAIFITVAGAVLISVHRKSGGGGVRLRRSFASLAVASLLFGIANTMAKYALDDLSFWTVYGINAVCLGGMFLLFSLRGRVLREIRDMAGRGPTLVLLGINEIAALTGFLLSFWAMERGPISLVSTLLATRPAFVFIFALGLSRFYPAALDEQMGRRVVAMKVTSIALVIGGVSLLMLSG
jgi:drug/metabolite transporter (DMT)-like permease